MLLRYTVVDVKGVVRWGFELGVTEVGPAEYPLLDVLRETIFGEFGHRSRSNYAQVLEGRKNVLTLIAHLRGESGGV